MAKLFVVLAFFAVVAVAMAASQEEQTGAGAKTGDLQTASSLYGGFYGGYPYGGYGYGLGYGGLYGGYGYGYPYGGFFGR